jgi:hypothetical protein
MNVAPFSLSLHPSLLTQANRRLHMDGQRMAGRTCIHPFASVFLWVQGKPEVHTLPDGQTITVDDEGWQVAEALLQPRRMGVDAPSVFESALTCAMSHFDPASRKVDGRTDGLTDGLTGRWTGGRTDRQRAQRNVRSLNASLESYGCAFAHVQVMCTSRVKPVAWE